MSDIFKTRRSIRKYKPEIPPMELIDQVVEAGLWAPSGRNSQCQRFIVITDKAMRDRVSALNAKIRNMDTDPFFGAPVIIMVIVDKNVSTHVYDGAVALENMMLKASELGLANCWIHRAKQEMETEFGQELLDRLGIEGEFEGIGHLALGYPDCEVDAEIPRVEGRVFYI